MRKKELIGTVGVDSGQLMLVDPYYVLRAMSKRQADRQYDKACKASGGRLGYGVEIFSGMGGVGAVFKSGWGDGSYDVYAYRDKDGRIRKVEVIMA